MIRLNIVFITKQDAHVRLDFPYYYQNYTISSWKHLQTLANVQKLIYLIKISKFHKLIHRQWARKQNNV